MCIWVVWIRYKGEPAPRFSAAFKTKEAAEDYAMRGGDKTYTCEVTMERVYNEADEV